MDLTSRFLLPLVLANICATSAFGDQALERDVVYRVQPQEQELVAVSPNEIKPGLVYKYYNAQLSEHVWGIARENGAFQYALGPGSMQPTDRFDLRLSKGQTKAILDERVPGLSKVLEGTGRDLFLQLNAEDRWQIHPSSSIAKVFDRVTGRRWEWHGKRRVAVLHTSGYTWYRQQDRYVPMSATLLSKGPTYHGATCLCP